MDPQGVTWKAPLTEAEALAMSPLHWAYVGDAVYELFVRRLVLESSVPLHKLHQRAVGRVSAEGQELVLERILPALSEAEAQIVRRGRNAKSAVPHGSNPATYRRSTALEALVGFLYLTGREERLLELLTLGLKTI